MSGGSVNRQISNIFNSDRFQSVSLSEGEARPNGAAGRRLGWGFDSKQKNNHDFYL